MEPNEAAAPEVAASEADLFAARLNELGRRAPVTIGLVVINVAVFVVMVVTGVHVMEPTIADLLAWGANFGPLTLAEEPWRLLTSTFVHIGIIHVLFNMWVLWDAGKLVERLLGSRSFLAMYLLAGLGGSVASLAWNPFVVSAGASGAVFGVIGALFGIVVRKRPEVPTDVLSQIRNSSLAFVGYNLLFGITVPGIDMAAHVGGLLVGFAAGAALAVNFDEAERIPRRVAAVSAVGLVLLAATFYGALNTTVADVQRDLDAFAKVEEQVNGEFNGLVEQAQNEALTDAEFARVLRDELQPRWRASMEALAAHSDVPEKLRQHLDKVVAYASKRDEYYRVLIEALETQNMALAAKAGELLKASNALAKDIAGKPE